MIEDGDVVLNEESDFQSVSKNLRLMSIQEEVEREKLKAAEIQKSDEELARMLQVIFFV